MAEFIAYELVPILATFWVAGGSVGLAFISVFAVSEFVLPPGRTEGTTERRQEAKTLAMSGSAYLLAVAMGLVMLRLIKQEAKEPQLIMLVIGSLVLLGGFLTAFFLWRGRRLG